MLSARKLFYCMEASFIVLCDCGSWDIDIRFRYSFNYNVVHVFLIVIMKKTTSFFYVVVFFIFAGQRMIIHAKYNDDSHRGFYYLAHSRFSLSAEFNRV